MHSTLPFEIERSDITLESADPALHPLFLCESPPIQLFIEGQKDWPALLARVPRDGLAIVGTRYPQGRTLHQVREVVRELASHAKKSSGPAPIIVSGFARGIDRAAHEAAIEFGLPTVAILGCGIDLSYPSHHAVLKRAVLQSPAGGLIVSEYEWKASAYASQFLARNRLIAQWTRATWVVEAGIQSGAMNTAKWARNGDRDCYATPGFPGDPSLAGNELLIDLHHATPLWGAHSLGRTWIELASLGPERRNPTPFEVRRGKLKNTVKNPSLLSGLAADLFETIYIRQRTSGALDPVSLLDWSIGRGYSPPEFFKAFEQLLEKEVIQEGPIGVCLKDSD